MAPAIMNGSAPLTTVSGAFVSGDSLDKSSLQAKNLTNGRRRSVAWSRNFEVIDFPPRKMRAVDFPTLAFAIGCQDKRGLFRAD
jgi:hypothetical protein